MLRSFYIAGTGMLSQRARMGALTNNLANADTPGYKKDMVLSRPFADLLIQSRNNSAIFNGFAPVGPQNTGVQMERKVTLFSQGNIEPTEWKTDFALEGQGFFVVETPEGNRYTRDGSFLVDNNGYLITAEGYYVSGTNGRIHVGNSEFVVDDQGRVTADGQAVGRLRVVTFDDLSGLRKVGSNLYSNYTGQAEREAPETKVMQGYLENSNVDMTNEVVSMIELNRSFELNQRVLRMVDESLAKTVNEVGRI